MVQIYNASQPGQHSFPVCLEWFVTWYANVQSKVSISCLEVLQLSLRMLSDHFTQETTLDEITNGRRGCQVPGLHVVSRRLWYLFGCPHADAYWWTRITSGQLAKCWVRPGSSSGSDLGPVLGQTWYANRFSYINSRTSSPFCRSSCKSQARLQLLPTAARRVNGCSIWCINPAANLTTAWAAFVRLHCWIT